MNTNEVCMQLFSTDKCVRDTAAKELGKRGKEGAQAVIPLLAAEDWALRYRAAEVLGLSGQKEFAVHLVPLLSDEKDHVRYMAVKSLGMIGDSFYADKVKVLTEDSNNFVVREAFRTLNKWRR